MKENPGSEEREDIKELLTRYQKLKSGNQFDYLEEEDFERIIDYYDDNNSFSAAIEVAEYGIHQFPFSSGLLVKKADLQIALQSFADALETLERVSVLDNLNVDMYILKTEAWLGLGENQKARDVFEHGSSLFSGQDQIDFLSEIADVFDDYDMFTDVYDCLEKILLIDSKNHDALFKISFWADYSGKSEESIKLHQKLIDDHPYNHLAWFNLGSAYQNLRLYEKAIDAYLYAAAIDDKFEPAFRNLGDAYIRLHNYKEAIGMLERVLELSVPDDVIYEALGFCYSKLRKNKQARSFLRKAVHLNPEYDHLYYSIAITYMIDGKWKNALDQLFQAVRVTSRKHPNYYYEIGRCYGQLGETDDAVHYLSKYIQSRPTAMKGWKELIKVLYHHQFYQAALVNCVSAYEATNHKPLFALYRAAVSLRMGKKQAALQILQDLKGTSGVLKELLALDPSIILQSAVVKIFDSRKRKKGTPKKRS